MIRLTETFCDIMISVRRVKDVSDEVDEDPIMRRSAGGGDGTKTHSSICRRSVQPNAQI